MTVELEAKASPSTGCEILENATLNCRLIVRAPAPTVIIKSITATYTEFDITFFVEELTFSAKAEIKELQSQGITFAFARVRDEVESGWPLGGIEAIVGSTNLYERVTDGVLALQEQEWLAVASWNVLVNQRWLYGQGALRPSRALPRQR